MQLLSSLRSQKATLKRKEVIRNQFTSAQSINPFPFSSNSTASPITFRLFALKGSKYWFVIICFFAAAIPPLFFSFSSITYICLKMQ